MNIVLKSLASLVCGDNRDDGGEVGRQIVLVIVVVVVFFLHLVLLDMFVFVAAHADADTAASTVIQADSSRGVGRVGLQVSVEVVAAAVALLAHGADVRPDALVQLLNVPTKAVELGEGLPANGPVVEDPPASLFIVQPFL